MPQHHNLAPIQQPAYKALTPETAGPYLASIPAVAKRIGGTPDSWNIREVGDGNLNLVFIVEGSNGAVVAKQALPYVRMVGESWPLPLSRAHYEYAALVEQTKYAPDLVPALYHHDHDMALTVMEYLSPHIILRKGLIQGQYYPNLAEHLGAFLAKTLFSTSDMNLPAAEKKTLIAQFAGNTAMCKIAEDLDFTEPYFKAPLNRHTAPQLNDTVAEIQQDTQLKFAAQQLKYKFLTCAEAMLHGDLHTGSIMVSDTDTRVIDPEFAFFGPMGFDIGCLLSNLLMAFFAAPAHGHDSEYQNWILSQLPIAWDHFANLFTQLWHKRTADNTGDAFDIRLETDNDALRNKAIQTRLEVIWHDAVGFGALQFIRRIIGLSHVEDFESIKDDNMRAMCERRALMLGRDMLHNPQHYQNPDTLVFAARKFAHEN